MGWSFYNTSGELLINDGGVSNPATANYDLGSNLLVGNAGSTGIAISANGEGTMRRSLLLLPSIVVLTLVLLVMERLQLLILILKYMTRTQTLPAIHSPHLLQVDIKLMLMLDGTVLLLIRMFNLESFQVIEIGLRMRMILKVVKITIR